MPSTALVWFRRDLRVHDHPPLTAALGAHDRVAPVFVFDDVLLKGRFPSPTRTAFLRECLAELDAALRERGGGLVFRAGEPGRELPALAQEAGAAAVYWASDVSPYARGRDERVAGALRDAGVQPVRTPGLFVADVSQPRTKNDRPFAVFTPFWKAWEKLERREVHGAPRALDLPPRLREGRLPSAEALGAGGEVAEPLPAGEAAARSAMHAWLEDGIAHSADQQDRFAQGSSMLSPYLHFGCLSPRELEARVGDLRGKGPAAYARQLAWRDFYAHVLLLNPGNARHEFQERYRDLEWDDDPALLETWTEGRTGYPLVDAGMRQLRATGWMHNRARLLVGSFLTKDLHLDWRHGEAHFMRYLLDGDEASNNGNWQWIASVGVDPAPYFRRMFNPALQQRRFDPDGSYVRRWVPELAAVPAARLTEPWAMSAEEQEAAGCVIGRDYPEPVVDHRRERERAMARYRAAADV